MKFDSRWAMWALVAVALACVMAFDASAGYLIAPAAAVALDDLPELASEFKTAVKDFDAKANKLSEAIAKADSDVKEHGKVLDETKGLITELGNKHEQAEREFEARLHALEQIRNAANDDPEQRKSLGEMFVESDALKQFASKGRHKGMSAPMELKDITSVEASAGDGIWSYRDPDIVSDPYRPLMLRSLIPTVPVNSNLVEWVQTNVRTNNAGPVSETGTKPKSDLTFDKKQSAVKKIAHYFKTSSEVLQDMPRLQAEINTEGFEMLRQEEEDQLLEGDGTGENLLGLIPQATGFDYGLVNSGDTRVDVLRRAILQVRQSFYSASGIVLNPADWAAIELMKDGENRYLFSSVTNGAEPRLWRLPVVESDALAEGEFLVGAFRQAATIYDRMVAAVFVSTENEDDFIKNMVSILFEERLALAVKRPLAFVHGNLSGQSA
ncbi:phage major capsid protein [Marilutibacter spongiae]|uniref:Phage major capsid protein n=1 Tax=Marilutibacter spongiae TaxID=2025720 RepID=A0A7W3Y5V0_9GAMM|nr:phage major capsid protein [Lysobacter spongiae]MBB1060419.1 phage major capsid protein [Lysobacter spongiae]